MLHQASLARLNASCSIREQEQHDRRLRMKRYLRFRQLGASAKAAALASGFAS